MLNLIFAVHTLMWSRGIEIAGSMLPLSVTLLIPLGIIWIISKRDVSRSTLAATLTISIPVLIWVLFAYTGICENQFLKAISTAPIFIFLAIISLEAGFKSTPNDWLKLRDTAFFVLAISITSIIIEIIFPEIAGESASKYHVEFKFSGIYHEPSHVAISLFPCIAILLISNEKKYFRKGLLSLIVLLLISRSSTLIALSLAHFSFHTLVRGKLTSAIKGLALATLLALFASTTNYENTVAPTIDRIQGIFNPEIENLSSIVYLKGWQDAVENLSRTNGMGLGFNMMGCSPLPDVSYRTFLSETENPTLNDQDGSFLFSKLISEFGIFGIVIFLAAISLLAHYTQKAIKANSTLLAEPALIPAAVAFITIASFLLRSTGYFQASLWLAIAALSGGIAILRHLQQCDQHQRQ